MPRTLADLAGTNLPAFRLGKPPTRATFDASGLTAPRALTIQDASGTLALTADVAAGVAYSVQLANHTGTQAAATISDFAAAALAATASAYDPAGSAAAVQALAVLLAGAQTVTGVKTFSNGLATTHCDAADSAGVHVGNVTHQDVAVFGAGGGQGVTLYGQLNGTAIDLTGAAGLTTRQAATQDAVKLLGRAGGVGSFVGTVTVAALTGARNYTLPDASLTFAGQNIDNAFSLAQTFAGGVPGTPSAGQVLIGGGAVKAGGGVSCTTLICNGTVTVPNGTVTAPGIRLTSYAHGLYYGSQQSVFVAVDGTRALGLYKAGWLATGAGFLIETTNAGDMGLVGATINTASIAYAAGNGTASGGQMRAYGGSHATKADYVEFTRGATVSAFFNGSGILTVNSTTDATTTADGSVRLSGGLSVADGKQIVQGSTSFHYWGASGVDGSWRFGRSGNDFVIQRRESAVWVTKQTIAA